VNYTCIYNDETMKNKRNYDSEIFSMRPPIGTKRMLEISIR
jgi:hypothetical protein